MKFLAQYRPSREIHDEPMRLDLRTGAERPAIPHGTDPEVIDHGSHVLIRWRDGRRQEERRYPPGTVVEWRDGAFRVGIHKDTPMARGIGA